MSHQETETWLNSARENLEEAVAEGSVPLARAIIQDLIDAGYGEQAMVLQREADRYNQEMMRELDE